MLSIFGQRQGDEQGSLWEAGFSFCDYFILVLLLEGVEVRPVELLFDLVLESNGRA